MLEQRAGDIITQQAGRVRQRKVQYVVCVCVCVLKQRPLTNGRTHARTSGQ
jgi:hypothetical protein